MLAALDADSTPLWAVNVGIADADAMAGQAVELGGGVVAGPFVSPGFRNAVLRDPQGAVFAVSAVSR